MGNRRKFRQVSPNRRFFPNFFPQELDYWAALKRILFSNKKISGKKNSREAVKVNKNEKEKFEGMPHLQGKFSTRKSRATVSLRQILKIFIYLDICAGDV
jgi:hypothetical protein